MWRHLTFALLFLFLFSPVGSVSAAGHPNDMEGSKDPALFTRMPGFYIYNAQDLEFDRYEFAVDTDKAEVKAPSDLLPCGDGPTAPVASNDGEGGRAKNRRVELVKQ